MCIRDRAVVGGVLLGGVGALMGAATAKKETTFTPGESEVIISQQEVDSGSDHEYSGKCSKIQP